MLTEKKLLTSIRGKAQEAIWEYLKDTNGEWFLLTEMQGYSSFRGLGYEKMMKGAAALAKKGIIEFKDLHRVRKTF